MLDISIPQLQKELTTQAKVDKFFDVPVYITEKFDGTKLTLIRNETPLDTKDRVNNWIVSYKGMRIFPEEFAGVTDDMLEHSIGICQYKRVFDFLRSIPEGPNEEGETIDIPKGTELFLEFIQNKPTLTRDYNRFGDIYLLGYDHPERFELGMRVETTSEKLQTNYVDWICDNLGFASPPCVFFGKVPTTKAAIAELLARFSDFESSLGGKAEGVVLTNRRGEMVKIVAADQYDKNVRKNKKWRYALDEPDESQYWETVRNQAKRLVTQYWHDDISTHLRYLSLEIYGMSENELQAKNPKKHHVVRRDDLMLTAKLINEEMREIRGRTIGLVPMAGRPVHAGHWCLIKNAAQENETVYLFVSVKGRGEGSERIEPGRMMKVWKEVLLPRLPKNVVLRFVESPIVSANMFVKGHVNDNLQFSFYGDVADVEERWSEKKLEKMFPTLYPTGSVVGRGFSRDETVNVSGTQMRQWLAEGSGGLFQAYLPQDLTQEERDRYIHLLRM